MAEPKVIIRIEENSTVTNGSEKTLTATYQNYSDFYELKPSNSGSWSETDLNALEISIVSAGTYGGPADPDNSARVTLVGIQIEYFASTDEIPPTFPPTDPGNPPANTPPDREVFTRLEVDWDFDGTYTDETDRIIGVRGTHNLVPPGQAVEASQGMIATMTATLDNHDNRYSSKVTTGALYAHVSDGQAWHAPARFSVTTDGGASWNQIFQGVIKNPIENTVINNQIRAITLDCRGNEEKIINRRVSLSQTNFASFVSNPQTESQLIHNTLNQAGINTGDMVLDTGVFKIPFFSTLNSSVAQTCWKLAASAGGRFYCNYQGDYVYENLNHWTQAPHTTSQATYSRGIDGDDYGFSDLRLYYDDTNLSKKVTIVGRIAEAEANTQIHNSSVLTTVAANTISKVLIKFDNPAFTITSFTLQQTGSASITQLDLAEGIELTVDTTGGSATTLTNVQVFGRPVVFQDRIETTKESTSPFWITARQSKERRITNDYIQSGVQTDALAQFVLDRQQIPTLFYRLIKCPGESARRLGDRITVKDEKVLSTTRDAFIIGINWSYDINGFSQDLNCIDAAFTLAGGGNPGGNPGGGDNEGAEFFIIDTDQLNGAKIISY